ncbi:nucleotidyltransferase HEPN domain-containing protein (plasmid) [Rhizobium gallicum]|uniref:Nucleotidyltransferase HEPN domain-containing protein n=1 Tax=Rhizobium gallicum TaxID=56730 RepID=A0A1L5NS01_9HYPH|nr:nucleotidyltransferase and HEPN domain-containing protein [Rhizobium gallicum]APO70667.1 nucleotidyltransferase HEPN domain-containing protein [Rhizobium gallicum]
MKSSLDHLPEKKQRELARVVEIIHEEFENALKGGEAEFKKKGRIWKVILFGSYARGTWVDEPHTMKGYRSDYDILIIVNTKKLTDAEYWYAAKDRLMRDRGIKTLVNPIIHSRREVGDALHRGQHFFSDIRRDGIVIYEVDNQPLPAPRLLSAEQAGIVATGHFNARFPLAIGFLEAAKFHIGRGEKNLAAFNLQQAIEASYSTFLLVYTNYAPGSHNLIFLRRLSEDFRRELAEVWPQDRQRYVAWFNVVNEAYVKARYSAHFQITGEALGWLSERTQHLTELIDRLCRSRLEDLSITS